MSSFSRLKKAFSHASVLPLTTDSRYILVSDCHRGSGTSGDNFLKNQTLYSAALQYYYDRGYSYIELGDGDELWENRSLAPIKSAHNEAFLMLSQYYRDSRLHMLYGNHDIVKRSPHFGEKHCTTCPCSTFQDQELFPEITFHQGIILKNTIGGKDIYLTHGHQADYFNCVLWKTARFLVRYIWKPLEQIGFLDPTSAAKNNTKKKKIEHTLTDWALANSCILVTGHTHRPMTGSSSSPYFNTGSCVHPFCITCIEIADHQLTLVKWTLATRHDRSVYVAREILTEPVNIGSV